MSKYKGRRMIVTADNPILPITHVGQTVITPWFNLQQVKLQNVFHVKGMKKNLLSVSQLTTSSNYVMFLKPTTTPIIKGH